MKLENFDLPNFQSVQNLFSLSSSHEKHPTSLCTVNTGRQVSPRDTSKMKRKKGSRQTLEQGSIVRPKIGVAESNILYHVLIAAWSWGAQWRVSKVTLSSAICHVHLLVNSNEFHFSQRAFVEDFAPSVKRSMNPQLNFHSFLSSYCHWI